MEMNERLNTERELTGEELKNIAAGNVGKDEARADYRVRCTNCGGSWWAGDVPDLNTCPACGAHGTLKEIKFK